MSNALQYLWRKDDGERFTRQEDGKYIMDSSMMGTPYRHSLESLLTNDFVDSPDKCVIVEHKTYSNSHSNCHDEDDGC